MLTRHGITTVIDATANRRRYRELARELMPSLIEVLVECPSDVRARRDPKGILRAAAVRPGNTVPGAGTPYEPPDLPDFVVDGMREDPDAAATRIIGAILARTAGEVS